VIDEHAVLLGAPAVLPSLPRVERIGWGRVRGADYRHQTADRRQLYAGVQITLAGRGWILDPGGRPRTPLPQGTALVFVAPRQQVLYGADPGGAEPWEFVYANLEGGASLATIGEMVARHGHAIPVDADDALVHALVARARSGVATRMPLAASARLAGEILALLAGGVCPDAGGDAAQVDAAMSWMLARLDRPVAVADAAAALGVSREHLTRRFVACCGEPPAAWLRRQRLGRAGILLRGGATVAATARACGFATASAFIAAWRRAFGTSPGAAMRSTLP
jgi:AraC-like DNA-binding protein